MKMKPSEFFAKKLSVPLRNSHWSWGAFDPISNRVFLRVWRHEIQNDADGECVQILWENPESKSNGYPERCKHIEAIRNGADGVGIVCDVADKSAETWRIRDYDDETLLLLGVLFKRGRAIYARIVERFPISDLSKRIHRNFFAPTYGKVTRICFNSENWQRPTGLARKTETVDTYNHRNGFGHEEWLFRSEWQIDGWRYAFLQGVNKGRSKLLRLNRSIDLTLFTIQPDKRRCYVATIRSLECLNEQQSLEALEEFKARGWFETMLKEIKAIGGNAKALGNSPEAKDILNVRFRLENVIRFKADSFVKTDEPIACHHDRYQIYDFSGSEIDTIPAKRRIRKGDSRPPETRLIFRRQIAPVEYTPEHTTMQKKLLAELHKEFPKAEIFREANYVDVSVRTKKQLLLFEIKSDLEPRIVIRLAIGQILEYGFHPQCKQHLPVRLFIVGRNPLSKHDKSYLNFLRTRFSLPVEYRVLPI